MSNLDRLRAALAESSVPALLVTDAVNVRWLTGFTGSFGRVIVSADRAIFVTDSRYDIQSAEEVDGALFELQVYRAPTKLDVLLAELCRGAGIDRLAFEGDHLAFAAVGRLREALGIELFAAPDGIVSNLRKVKTPAEIQKLRAACALTDAAFDHVRRLLQPGVTELDIDIEIEFFFRRNGAACGFPSIVVSGANSARPHGKATEKKLEVGDFVTLDFGAKLDGYHGDMTRTVVIGQATDRHREVYAQVLAAQLAAIDAIRPGVVTGEVDRIAREVLAEKDLDRYFGHGLGHGLGLEVHDPGRLATGAEELIEVGQVWTVEPGVYIEGFGGVRIEDDVVVTESGVEILNRSPKELLVLP